MWHATCTQGNQGDSQLLIVESQIDNLTPSLSFGHNLCFKCPNGSCKPILDIYVSTCIILCLTYSIHPTHKQALLFYSTIFRIWKGLDFRTKPFQKISSYGNFCWKRFLYDEFHPLFSSCPHGKILCHVNFVSILNGKEYSKNILSTPSKDF